jgi:hypothetical protein
MELIDCTGSPAAAPLTGGAAGVPYVALPPSSGSRRAPLVVAWHLLGPPRSQHAMVVALPMGCLSAWRVYLRLPMLGARAPLSDPEDLVRCGAEDLGVSLPSPVIERAVAAFPAVAAALRARLPVDDAPIGQVGGSVAAAVVLLTLVEGEVPARGSAAATANTAGGPERPEPTHGRPPARRGADDLTPRLDMASVAMSGRR